MSPQRSSTDHAYKPHPERDENAQLARFANQLSYYTGDKGDHEAATRAMRYLATPEIATAWLSAPILLAETEYTRPPIHITVIGASKDPAAKALFQDALAAAPPYRQDRVVGPGRRALASCRCPISDVAACCGDSSALRPPAPHPYPTHRYLKRASVKHREVFSLNLFYPVMARCRSARRSCNFKEFCLRQRCGTAAMVIFADLELHDHASRN